MYNVVMMSMLLHKNNKIITNEYLLYYKHSEFSIVHKHSFKILLMLNFKYLNFINFE